MEREKQIDEMAKLMCFDCQSHTQTCERMLCDSVLESATVIYNAGYRKMNISNKKVLESYKGYHFEKLTREEAEKALQDMRKEDEGK